MKAENPNLLDQRGRDTYLQRNYSLKVILNQKLITLPYGAPHTKMCIDHMIKIAANGTQRRDDIADSCYDAIKISFIDKRAISFVANEVDRQENAKKVIKSQGVINTARVNIWV